MKKDEDDVFVNGAGMHCKAKLEEVPTEGIRAALHHVRVSVPATNVTFARCGRIHYWVPKSVVKELIA